MTETNKPEAIATGPFGVGGSEDVVVRSLMVPLNQVTLLLPATAVAEVAVISDPSRETDRQPWYLGTAMWRGLAVPLISYNVMLGLQEVPLDNTARVVVMNGITGNDDLPFYSILATGIPRLLQARKGTLDINTAAEPNALVASRLFVGEQECYLPDLDQVELTLIRVGGRVRSEQSLGVARAR